jgi:hypothetical protein
LKVPTVPRFVSNARLTVPLLWTKVQLLATGVKMASSQGQDKTVFQELLAIKENSLTEVTVRTAICSIVPSSSHISSFH